MATCPQCQHRNPTSARFCNHCGGTLDQPGPTARPGPVAPDRWGSPLRTALSVLLGVAFVVSIPGGLVYLIGLSMKTSPEYRCAMYQLETSKDVDALVGSPLTAGTFAWVSHWETSGAISQGHFSTSISGPKGKGSVDVSAFRAPASSSFLVTLTAHEETRTIYKGAYPCD